MNTILQTNVITYDDLKSEYVKRKLYGYLESSCILCPEAGETKDNEFKF